MTEESSIPQPEASRPRNPITRGVERTRNVLGRHRVTRWLFGGAESDVSHTLRQGMLAALMIMVGSWGVGWLAMSPTSLLALHPWLLPLRSTTAGVVICTVLLTFGALLLLRSWLRLAQRVGQWSAEATGVMYRATAMWGGPLLLTIPIFSRDVYSYLAQGRLLFLGENPYETGVSELPGWFMAGADGLWAESPSPYGPLFLMISQSFWYLSEGIPEVAVALFRLLSVVGVLLMLAFIPRLARAFGSEPSWALWICLLNPMSLLVFLPAAHNDSLMIGLMMAGCWYALQKKRLVALLLLVAAVAVKPIAMVIVPFAVLLSLESTKHYLLRLREWGIAGLLGGGALILAGYALGIGLGWLPSALSAGSAIEPIAPVGLLGTGAGMFFEWIIGADPDLIAGGVHLLARLAAAVVLTVMLLRRPLGDSPRENLVLWSGYGLTVVVLSSTVLQPWYLLWLLPLFAVVHVYRGRLLMWVILLITVLVLLSMVGQLSVAQWIDTLVVQSIAMAVAVVYLLYIIAFDPHTSELFHMRRRSARWNADEGWTVLRSRR